MSETENKFESGKIYFIWNDCNDEIYVGSTCQSTLAKRMTTHRDQRNSCNHRKLYTLMNEIGVDKFHIELIELFPCSCKDELRKREGFHIRQIGTLNVVIEDRTRKEYKETNKDKIKEYMKTYREDKKEHILEKTKEYRENNGDKIKQYKIDNKEKIVAQRKEYYERTKEVKQEYQKSDKVKAWKK